MGSFQLAFCLFVNTAHSLNKIVYNCQGMASFSVKGAISIAISKMPSCNLILPSRTASTEHIILLPDR